MIQYLTIKHRPEGSNWADDILFDAIKRDQSSFEGKWIQKSFAGKLKEVCSLITGIPVEKFSDQKFKKTNMPKEWGIMTVREFMQKIGTDACRDHVHDDIWINALFSDYKIVNEELRQSMGNVIDYSRCFPKWILTDMRFPNEYEAITKRHGITIRVERDGSFQVNEHISETALDRYTFNYIIHNNGTLEKLLMKVHKLLVTAKLITNA